MKKLLKIVCLCIILCCRPVLANDIVDVKAHTSYNAETAAFEALLEFSIRSGWHIFAPYDQAFGAPLTIRWQLPDGIVPSEESFSRTKHFSQQEFSFDGYENKAFYKTTIRNAGNIGKFPVTVHWQACKDECIPGSAELLLSPVKSADFNATLQKASQYFSGREYLPRTNWLLIILAAFGGGLILNLMPCIFPILSIKIISLAQMQEHSRRQEAFFYTAGVIVSMLAVAGILSFIRRFDTSAGWGFQMQSPWFVGVMLALFILLSLMMLDIITFNGGLFNKLALLKFTGPRANAFMTGLLAVLIASPCTAPFMGAAVGYALMAPPYVYFPVFAALGLGYALPFALLTIYPKPLRRILPRPGPWMAILKKALSVPVILTCIWLAWILAAQSGLTVSGKNLQWQDYSRQRVDQALSEKRPVFIDFTAKWCITCLVNKKTALQSDVMARRVKEKNILLLRADITNQNKEAAAGLAAYKRASIPLYVYYDGKSDDYLLLPQILTPGVLQEYLQ